MNKMLLSLLLLLTASCKHQDNVEEKELAKRDWEIAKEKLTKQVESNNAKFKKYGARIDALKSEILAMKKGENQKSKAMVQTIGRLEKEIQSLESKITILSRFEMRASYWQHLDKDGRNAFVSYLLQVYEIQKTTECHSRVYDQVETLSKNNAGDLSNSMNSFLLRIKNEE